MMKRVLYCENKNTFLNNILYECGYNNYSSNFLSFSQENAGRNAVRTSLSSRFCHCMLERYSPLGALFMFPLLVAVYAYGGF